MSEVVELRGYVEKLSQDLSVLTKPSSKRSIPTSDSPNALWMTVRNLCLDTEYPVAALDAEYQPQTAFGGRVLTLITSVPSKREGDVSYARGTSAGLCISAEPLFASYASLSNPMYHRPGETKPVIVRSGEDIVGLFKPEERPGILGLTDAPEFGLFAGVISGLKNSVVQDNIVEATKGLDGVGAVDIADLFRLGAGMRVVRATTFALDQPIREGFSKHNRAGKVGYQGVEDVLLRIKNAKSPVRELPLDIL